MGLPQIYGAGVFDSDVIYRRSVSVTSERRVHYYELEFYLEDCGVAFINENEYKITNGCVLFARPNDLRHSLLPMKSHYVRFGCDDEYLLSILDGIPELFVSAKTDEYISLVRELIRLQNDTREQRELEMAAIFLLLLGKLYDECKIVSSLKESTMPHASTAVTQAKAYIEQNYTSPCLLSDIASHVSFSPIYFHKMFRVATGMTPYQYVCEVRIKHACQFLLTNEAPLSQIGEKCGFSSQQYFNYAFKKQTGMTPTQYKLSMQKKYLPKE